MDDREKYKERIKKEEEQSQINRAKRDNKKRIEKQKRQADLERLKNHSTGLINWVKKENSQQWDGYVDGSIWFKISQGIYKYSLTVYVETENKSDKNIKTAFELEKLQKVAESITSKTYINQSAKK